MSLVYKRNYPNIIWRTIKKMSNIRAIANNSMLVIVLFVALFATILFIEKLVLSGENLWLYWQMVFWIWMVLFFSALAQSYAESKLELYKTKSHLKDSNLKVKKINKLSHSNNFQRVIIKKIKSGDLILLKKGDTVPFDGVIIKGSCYVNETIITGELGKNLKNTKDNILTAGSIIESNDSIVMKVSSFSKFSFCTRTQRLLKKITRQSLPSELALQKLVLGLSVLFLSVIFTIWVVAKYSGYDIPLIYLLDLIIILLPTTISGLQHAIIIFFKAQLYKSHIVVSDDVALDNVVDINIIFLDKTGTLTVGKRQMIDFQPVCNLSIKEYMKFIFLSSKNDNTYEGKSIKAFVNRYSDIKSYNIKKHLYKSIAFSTSQLISGCDYDGISVRKGSVRSIAKYIGKSVNEFPKKILEITTNISTRNGTPLLITVNKKIIGVINLRDRVRVGTVKQIDKLHAEGIQTIMVTGDNSLTASCLAEKLGIKIYYAEATPKKKLTFVKKLQQEGYIVAMCGDGINDALALAQADIGFTFEDTNDTYSIMSGNVISKKHDLSTILNLKHICKSMVTKRGALTVFALSSDIAKYFVIVPALLTTAFQCCLRLISCNLALLTKYRQRNRNKLY